jgi:hypothetical protein
MPVLHPWLTGAALNEHVPNQGICKGWPTWDPAAELVQAENMYSQVERWFSVEAWELRMVIVWRFSEHGIHTETVGACCDYILLSVAITLGIFRVCRVTSNTCVPCPADWSCVTKEVLNQGISPWPANQRSIDADVRASTSSSSSCFCSILCIHGFFFVEKM